MTLEELEKKRNELKKNLEAASSNTDKIICEANRVADVAHNSGQILDDLDKEFEQQTGLNEKDMAFLFVAVGLQCTRIFLLNHITRIQKAGSGNTLEASLHEHQKTILGKLDNGVVDTARPYYAPLIRSLKEACYADTKLVYKCLKLLATSYYDYRTGIKTYEEFTQECKAVDSGLEERGAITDVAAGMEGETYFVQYRGKKRKLERHLAKGSSKDRRYCLRIYFFWDAEDQVVVIGDLPYHLDTTAT